MIEQWPPLILFCFYMACSGSTAVALLFLSSETITLRKLVGTAVFHGLVGGGLGMQVYEWKKIVWASLMVSIGYGAGVVKLSQSKAILLGLLKDNGPNNKHDV
jgi:hypothetical protein